MLYIRRVNKKLGGFSADLYAVESGMTKYTENRWKFSEIFYGFMQEYLLKGIDKAKLLW